MRQSGYLVRSTLLFIVTVCLTSLSISSGALAEGFQITPFLGYRVGGHLEDAGTGEELNLSESETYGVIIGKDTGPETQIEFYYSFQPSSLTANGTTTGVLTDVDVEYFHVSGLRYMGEGTARPFVVGSLGATHFNPHLSTLGSDTRFSMGLGGGVELGVSERIAIRLEGRGFATFFNSSGAVFCDSSSGCSVFVASNLLLQFEVGAGVAFKF